MLLAFHICKKNMNKNLFPFIHLKVQITILKQISKFNETKSKLFDEQEDAHNMVVVSDL
jgi:hypothetical protein